MTKLERLRQRLETYYDAEAKILNGQEYRIGDRTLRRADLSTVQSMIESLESEIDSLETPGRGLRRVVFVT